MPTDAASAGGYIATNGVWNNTGMLPQVDVAQFIVDEVCEPKHLGHVVGLSARQPLTKPQAPDRCSRHEGLDRCPSGNSVINGESDSESVGFIDCYQADYISGQCVEPWSEKLIKYTSRISPRSPLSHLGVCPEPYEASFGSARLVYRA